MIDLSSAILKVKEMDKIIRHLKTSIKSDEQGVSQKEKRVLNKKIDSIYKELISLSIQQKKDQRKER
tara:strand:+ start:140 stop:340 length:201 start_codon:yes stop_codon:yes gene_type:complete